MASAHGAVTQNAAATLDGIRSGSSLVVVFAALLYGYTAFPYVGWGAVLLALLTSVGFYAVLPRLWESAARSNLKAQSDVIGDVEMEIVSDGIVSRKGSHELKTTWKGIGNVVTSGEYTFIYIAEDMALIIPHRRITGGNYVLFLQELARGIEAHTLAPLSISNTIPAETTQNDSVTQVATGAETITMRRSVSAQDGLAERWVQADVGQQR